MERLLRWHYAARVLFGQQYVAALCAMGVEELWIKQGRTSIAKANQNSILDNIGVDGFHRPESSERPSACRSDCEQMRANLDTTVPPRDFPKPNVSDRRNLLETS